MNDSRSQSWLMHPYAPLLHKPPKREVYMGTLPSRGAWGCTLLAFPEWPQLVRVVKIDGVIWVWQ